MFRRIFLPKADWRPSKVGNAPNFVEKLEIRELKNFCEQRKLPRIHTGLGATRYQRSPHGRSRNLATRALARTDGDGRGATEAWQHHAPHGFNEPSTRILSSERGIGQAARTNFGLTGAFVGSTNIEGEANGESRLTGELICI
jgi:hypothetical protein